MSNRCGKVRSDWSSTTEEICIDPTATQAAVQNSVTITASIGTLND